MPQPSTITLDHVRRALKQPCPGLPAQLRMFPRRLQGNDIPPDSAGGNQAAVLVLCYERDGAPHIALTRRAETVQHHKGQVSLPGGAREGSESPVETALREAHEELGIETAELEVLGSLTPLYVGVSNFLITPITAISAQRPTFRPDPVEVAEVIEAPLARLLDPALRIEEEWNIRGQRVQVPFFAIGPHKVWGATAMILAEFGDLLQRSVETLVQ